jgi:hypothetical protein
MRSRASLLALACALPSAAAACRDSRALAGTTPTDAGPSFVVDAPTGDDAGPIGLEAGPSYALLAVVPSHGPFNGGTLVSLRGRGLSSATSAQFGGVVVPSSGVTASDPYHAQLTTPAGDPGSVDVTVRDDHTGSSALLRAGFTYDDFYADPSNGSTVGGTHIVLAGRGTKWVTGTTVAIDGKPCTALVVDGPERMHCTTPAGLPGVKSIDVTTPDGTVDSVADAYTYADTVDGYRGGLAGPALPGELDVLALNDSDGTFIPAATVVVRGADGTEQRGMTNTAGIASFASPPPAPLTVTVAKKCLQPWTFDKVSVSDVTVYMQPVASIDCIPPSGQPPPGGGRSVDTGLVTGEIVFPTVQEFERGPFAGIPGPTTPTQRQVAYVFVATGDPTARFVLPDASAEVTAASPGTIGYSFSLYATPGNVAIYALAGLEDRPKSGPATFEPYVFGLVRGVGVVPNAATNGVFIPMSGKFDESVSLAPSMLPMSPRGPDRLRTTVAVALGTSYMTLPYGYVDTLLPTTDALTLLPMPGLVGALASASYTVDMEAVTGGPGGAPMSVVQRDPFRVAGSPVSVGPFVPLPKMLAPIAGTPWDGKTVQLDLPAGAADLLVVGVASADGSTGWTVVTTGDTRTVNLPDFSANPELTLPHGSLQIGVSAAKLSGLTWGELRYGQLSRGNWSAFAYDVAYASW